METDKKKQAREAAAAYMRVYRRKNPEKAKQYRLNYWLKLHGEANKK